MNIGIIGVGNWGNRVTNEYINLLKEGKIDNIFICDKKNEIIDKYKDYTISDNYKSFLRKEKLDGVHICTPNKTHFDIAKEAILNKKHVLVEKPLTENPKKAYELIQLSAENNIVLEVGHIYRFANVIREIKKLEEKNYFGKIKYITFKWTNYVKNQDDIFYNVDIIWDLLPHIIDIIHFLTQKWPSKSYVLRKEKQMSFLNLDYDDFIVNIEFSWITNIKKREMLIVGDKRACNVECVKQKAHVYEIGKNFDLNIKDNNTIKDEEINFINSIKNGEMKYNSHIIGAKTVDVINSILKE